MEHVARATGWTGPRTCPSRSRRSAIDVDDLTEVEYLFWVGCAGAFEDRAKKTTRAVAELLHMAGVDFAVLGKGETCTGDPARRAGNEFVFQQLATENAETLNEAKATKVVATCAHCFNTLKNEYAQFGVELEVVHHTQLLNRLVRDGRLTPVAPAADGRSPRRRRSPTTTRATSAGTTRSTTRRASCSRSIPDATFAEMPRNSRALVLLRRRRRPDVDGGEDRQADQRQPHRGGGRHRGGSDRHRLPVLPGDALRRADRAAGRRGMPGDEVEVLDVAQLLLTSVKRGRTD